jgi:hypothetical protein
MRQLILGTVQRVVSVAVLASVPIAAIGPRAMTKDDARASAGGCGSGNCSFGAGNLCTESNDGCGVYEQCQGSTGNLFCTPAKFCTGAGCSTVDSQSCK